MGLLAASEVLPVGTFVALSSDGANAAKHRSALALVDHVNGLGGIRKLS
jgi:hypothetical protein